MVWLETGVHFQVGSYFENFLDTSPHFFDKKLQVNQQIHFLLKSCIVYNVLFEFSFVLFVMNFLYTFFCCCLVWFSPCLEDLLRVIFNRGLF